MRFGGRVNAYVQFFDSYWTLPSVISLLQAPVTQNFYQEGGFCEDTSWQGKTSGWKVPGCEECSFHWEAAAGGWREQAGVGFSIFLLRSCLSAKAHSSLSVDPASKESGALNALHTSVLSHVRLGDPKDVACQAALSMGFPR